MTQVTHSPLVTHYHIVSGTDAATLHKAVESALHNGWQPHGSLAIMNGDAGAVLLQPVVRYAELFR